MADSIDADAPQEQTGGLFSSGFSKIGAAMPTFSTPWTPKDDSEAPAEDAAQDKGGFLSGVSGGFSKLTGGLPSVSAPSFGLPWGKKDDAETGTTGATGTGTGTGTEEGAPEKTAFLAGGFSKLTGGLPSVNVPSFGLPWGKKDGEPEEAAGEPQPQANGKTEFLSGVSGGLSKLTGGLPSVSVPSFGLPWGKKDGEAAEVGEQADVQPAEQPEAAAGAAGAAGAGLNKLSSAMTGIFGVFKTADDGAKAAEDTTPK